MMLNRKLKRKLISLKENPRESTVDHLSILHDLCFEYSDGRLDKVKPIMDFYFEKSFNDLPTLKEKHLWNEDRYNELFRPFIDSQEELVDIITKLLKK